MSASNIERDFQQDVSESIQLVREGMNRFRVLSPFQFDDGDHLAIVLKKEQTTWVLSDEAHTYMRRSYGVDERDLHTRTRQQIISNALAMFGVEDHDGELRLEVQDGRYGDALFSFVQALLRIGDVS